jgi:hypothetical protein
VLGHCFGSVQAGQLQVPDGAPWSSSSARARAGRCVPRRCVGRHQQDPLAAQVADHDGTVVLMIVGQVPFEFTGVLKVNPDTGEVILEPRHTVDTTQVCRLPTPLTRNPAAVLAGPPTPCPASSRLNGGDQKLGYQAALARPWWPRVRTGGGPARRALGGGRCRSVTGRAW